MFAIDTSYHSVTRSKSRSLAGFLAFNAKQSKHYDIGHYGEKLAIAMLEDDGFKAFKPSDIREGDIHAVDRVTGELFKIEVKTSTYSEASRKWQFCLKKGTKTDCRYSDYVLFILIDKNRVFTYLVPSSFLGDCRQLSITARPESYRGKIAPFFNRGSLSFQAACNTMALKTLQ